MKNCTIKQLNVAAESNDLPEFGQIVIPVEARQITIKYVAGSGSHTITLKDGGAFSDSSTSKTVEAGITLTDTLSAAGTMVIPDKYNIENLIIYNTGAFEELFYLSKATNLATNSSNDITSDIITGYLNTCVELRSLKTGPATVAGSITYDISNLKKAEHLEEFSGWYLKAEGEVSDLNSPLKLIYVNIASFTWASATARPSNYNIIRFYSDNDTGINFGDDIDNMLINQANCNNPHGGQLNKSFVVNGNCSFSTEVNAAIATLKTVFATVKINGVVQ